MDNWLIRLFLMLAAMACLNSAQADEFEDIEPVIEPIVERIGLEESNIDDENFEIGAFFGFMSIEHFGTDEVYGIQGAWHITEDLFFQGSYGTTTVGKTTVEDFNDLNLISDEDRDFIYYNVSMGFNALPGEIFLGKDWAFNSQFYFLLGAGSVEFLGDREFAINMGGGLRILATDAFALHMAFQDLITDKPVLLNPLNREGTAHNMQYTFGLTYFF